VNRETERKSFISKKLALLGDSRVSPSVTVFLLALRESCFYDFLREAMWVPDRWVPQLSSVSKNSLF
jgi:hypothetical protein